MTDAMVASKEALLQIMASLRDDRAVALLDYAEYLLGRQAEEDEIDIADSRRALAESGSTPWDEVKRVIDAGVQD